MLISREREPNVTKLVREFMLENDLVPEGKIWQDIARFVVGDDVYTVAEWLRGKYAQAIDLNGPRKTKEQTFRFNILLKVWNNVDWDDLARQLLEIRRNGQR